MTDKLTLQEALKSPQIEKAKTNVEKALLLAKDFNFSKKELFDAGLTHPATFYRAQMSARLGYNIGETGRRQDLCDRDESILLHWIQELLDQNEVIYSWKLISLVCSYLFFMIYRNINIG